MNITKKTIAGLLSVTVSFSFIVAFMLSPVKVEAAKAHTFTNGGVKYQVVKEAVYNEEDEAYDDGTCMVIGADKNTKKIEIGESIEEDKGDDTLNYTIVSIKKGAFKKHAKLTTFTLLEESKITAIPDNCFTGCKKLTKVELKNTLINKIGKNAMKDCTKLSYITIKSDKITKVSKIGKDAFKNTKKGIKVEGSETKMSKKYQGFVKKRGAKNPKYVKATKTSSDDEEDEEDDSDFEDDTEDAEE